MIEFKSDFEGILNLIETYTTGITFGLPGGIASSNVTSSTVYENTLHGN